MWAFKSRGPPSDGTSGCTYDNRKWHVPGMCSGNPVGRHDRLLSSNENPGVFIRSLQHVTARIIIITAVDGDVGRTHGNRKRESRVNLFDVSRVIYRRCTIAPRGPSEIRCRRAYVRGYGVFDWSKSAYVFVKRTEIVWLFFPLIAVQVDALP